MLQARGVFKDFPGRTGETPERAVLIGLYLALQRFDRGFRLLERGGPEAEPCQFIL
ncbi:hypothetical protein AAJCM20276_02240 [Acetobacter aceti]|uniref:Uncharacterized protein n=1 Tax=Acetobacter aceti TaxID=435 RepID=A0A6S6PFA5_ACEAC|nr:hypothetical protein AAJCM20276_02240 [Acetobacter aceti]